MYNMFPRALGYKRGSDITKVRGVHRDWPFGSYFHIPYIAIQQIPINPLIYKFSEQCQ